MEVGVNKRAGELRGFLEGMFRGGAFDDGG